ncbi:MAG: GntR family transcriptional regulator [Lacisediminihabitans sp.]
MVEALGSTSKSEQAYLWIRERIANHAFSAGYRLVLVDIAQAIGCSVVPVREAIRRLEAEGLVTFEHNVGARVAAIDKAEYLQTMQTLGLVEGLATALAAPLLDDEALARAEAINDRLRALLADFDPLAFTQLNAAFHAELYASCPNEHLMDLVQRGWSRLSSLRETIFNFVPGRARESVDEHAQLLELIRSGAEPLEIELAVRRHRWRTMDAVLAHHPASSDHREGPIE